MMSKDFILQKEDLVSGGRESQVLLVSPHFHFLLVILSAVGPAHAPLESTATCHARAA